MISIECSFKQEGVGKTLSNLSSHAFTLDGIKCGSIEGFLQSLKFSDPEEQRAVAALAGYAAWKIGQNGNDWKNDQILWWNGEPYERASKAYAHLLTRAYDAALENNVAFAAALAETGDAVLTHHMGAFDQRQTVLTQTEYVFHLYRLRARVQQMLREDQ